MLYVLANFGSNAELVVPMKCNLTLNFDSEPAMVEL
jgi:hypothetical protein